MEILCNRTHDMNKQEKYKQANEAFLQEKKKEEGVKELAGGVLYEIIETGSGTTSPNSRSVVTFHYTGELYNGNVFDDSRQRGCPEACRVRDLIEGFQTALMNMHKGDRWIVYIPWQKGYGKTKCDDIPGYSTLVFDLELVSIN